MSNYNSGVYYGNYPYNIGTSLEQLLPAALDIYIDQGDTYSKTFTIRDDNGDVINLSGMSISVSCKRYYNDTTTYALIGSISDAVGGKIALNMSATETSKLKNSRYVYEVKIYDTYSTVRVMYGQVLVSLMV